ncbi:hypothetical protein ADUPG1_010551, partial [Aduncisulcus paluster]
MPHTLCSNRAIPLAIPVVVILLGFYIFNFWPFPQVDTKTIGSIKQIIAEVEAEASSAHNSRHHEIYLQPSSHEVYTPGWKRAMDYVFSQMAGYKVFPHPIFQIDIEQKGLPPGSSTTTTLGHAHSVNFWTSGTQAIVIRIALRDSEIPLDELPCILVSAHVDSTFAGPGISDDFLGVATSIQVIRDLMSSKQISKELVTSMRENNFGIVFAFLGEEENTVSGSTAVFQASSFIRQCSFVVNIEAMGCGGALSLTRTKFPSSVHTIEQISQVYSSLITRGVLQGNKSPFNFSSSASPPPDSMTETLLSFLDLPFISPSGLYYGNSLTQEIMEKHLISNATDLKNYLDLGMDGMDVVFVARSDRYHHSVDD